MAKRRKRRRRNACSCGGTCSGCVRNAKLELEWEQPYRDTDYWDTYVGDYTLVVTTDDLGLYPGGRWYWTLIAPGGWQTTSSRGFRSKKSAQADAERFIAAELSTAANPIQGMPGGSVRGCIRKMKKRKDIRDPEAYCAAIADRVEPGWREENPGFWAGALVGAAGALVVPLLLGSRKLELTYCAPGIVEWWRGFSGIQAVEKGNGWEWTVVVNEGRVDSRVFSDFEDGKQWALKRLEEVTSKPSEIRHRNPRRKKADVSAISRRLKIR